MTRVSDAERADAADRLMDVLDDIRASIRKTDGILRESAPVGSIYTFPKFVRGADIVRFIDLARGSLHEARNLVAVQGYECSRSVIKNNEH